MLLTLLLYSVAFARLCVAFPPSYFEARTPALANRTLGVFSTDQLIDVTAGGKNAFQPPSADDYRGPCPGLNALANHNFIPHSGIVGFATAILQSNRVFGLELDTATIAAVLALFGADLLSPDLRFSIGAAPTPGLLSGILVGLGLAGPPTGLSGTHNQFESDSSVTRGNFYQFDGNNYNLQLPYFQALYDLQPGPGDSDYDQDVIFRHSQIRFRQSIAQDPDFFYGPVQMFVSCLTHNLVYGLMSNHSAERPNGFLSRDVLASLYAVSPDASGGALQYTPGHERIPESWYRRPFLDEYGALHVLPDLLAMWLRFPELLLVGGNVAGVNTYAPIDIGNFTGGVYSAALLLEGDNAACFALQALRILVPDALAPLGGAVGAIVAKIVQATGPLLAGLTCPELTTLDRDMLERYPGYQKTMYPV
ncbi:Chloroperoxidase [Mycena vulgaris]|nr:Chloroperoxidase [Mycena vulgaris]